MPDQLVGDLGSFKTPKSFLSLPPKEHKNQFPHGNLEIVCLHVASRYQGINFDDIDLAFGGSTLEMLPGTETIIVCSTFEYIANLSNVGFQFERLMTGKPMDDTSSNICASVEHLQLMNIGSYRLFFRAETDAILDGSPVEITSSDPRYWGTRIKFQMISSGSTKLCSGTRSRGKLQEVMVQSLHQVAGMAHLHSTRREILERNILECMERMQSQMEGAKPGEVFRVSFHGGGTLKLLPFHGRSAAILPPSDIVLSMVSSTQA